MRIHFLLRVCWLETMIRVSSRRSDTRVGRKTKRIPESIALFWILSSGPGPNEAADCGGPDRLEADHEPAEAEDDERQRQTFEGEATQSETESKESEDEQQRPERRDKQEDSGEQPS